MHADTSIVLQTIARGTELIFLVIAAWLLVAGHNLPGGGFVAGLAVGAAVGLGKVAATGTPLERWARPRLVLPAGLAVTTLVAMLPVAVGRPLLDIVQVDASVPVFGTVKVGTALLFDLGVLLIVVGLIAAVLDAFVDLKEPEQEVRS